MSDREFDGSVRSSFSKQDAWEHWHSGNGSTVTVSMSSHLTTGGGSVFSASSFGDTIGRAVNGLPAGSVVHFETTSKRANAEGAVWASSTYSYYANTGFMSDESYVWGNTSAGFRGTATVMSNGEVELRGEIRAVNEQFDFKNNTFNLALEAARFVGGLWSGPGTPYRIEFVGPGKPVVGKFRLQQRVDLFETYTMREVPYCFPASTPIAVSENESRFICDLRAGDTVISYDPTAAFGRGSLVPRRVTRIFGNTTNEWVKLSWLENNLPRELVVTPGHHFLDPFGNFPPLSEMINDGRESGGAKLVHGSGGIVPLRAE